MAEFILKDWYGKEKTFDKETIYVQGKDGNLIPFKEKPTLQEKTITENGEYTADSGFDGLGKVTVEVAGSGGGSLPAGLYWEQISPALPLSYSGAHFLLNGELYLAQKTASSADVYNIYKFVDGAYTAVLSSVTIYSGTNPVSCGDIVHFIWSSYHYTFDGTTITRLDNAPVPIEKAVWYDGTLIGYYSVSKNYYKWDVASGTWTDTGIKYCGYNFIYNGELYALNGTKISKIDLDAGTSSEIATISFYARSFFVSADGELWVSSNFGSEGMKWYRYNFDNNTITFVAEGIPLSSSFYHYAYNGENRFGSTSSGFYKMHVRMREVTE